MTENLEVICEPLDKLEQVLSWKNYNTEWSGYVRSLSGVTDYFASGTQKCHETVLRPQPRCMRNSVPRTLVCHDMQGGYLEDRFLADSTKHDSYRFFHWTGIDTFVYFSHHFVTIPPVGWINAAHLHGVKILGTVITEWKDGEKMWEEILKSDEIWQSFAKALCDICHHYNFDGYLLNIENVIAPELMGKFQKFVDLFVETLHKTVTTGEVIWYDSVTQDGKLAWQNELNIFNRIFFDKCDGVFLNYAWSERHLQNSVKNAGIRGYDVYVGVDVFGRKFYGGGGFQTRKAVELIRKHNLSIAVFAQAWVYECFKQSESFIHREYAFWQMLWPYLFVHGPTDLPFSTSFCQGSGHKYFSEGRMVSETNWYNLRRQQYQPCATTCLNHRYNVTAEEHNKSSGIYPPVEDTGCMIYYADDAFQGGGCLLLKWSRIESTADEISEAEAVPGANKSEKEPSQKEMTESSPKPLDPVLSCKSCHDETDVPSGDAAPSVDAIVETGEATRRPDPAPEVPESFYKRLIICKFEWSGLLLVSVAIKDINHLDAKLDILFLIQESSGKYSMKELLDTYTSSPGDEGVYPYPQPDILNKEIFELYGRYLPKPAENSGWRINHYLFHVNGTILEIGAKLRDPGTEILLGYLSLYPYGRRYRL
ncbi:cytosolic endo-beta-N-acetylglucosaminidase isoform X1 [Schistocerca piceifrons]|uniref:cytosolic endo-beta-N-acetylglucosaminidase isoform X1 n=1 Tax=Schistocerca piceifrons TaxID=274613 RepID=UPI001F5FB2AC|nr:cytosolic endo-beta-N-acetylglucosaminidase isoform X1 [Schistocerca piceifrons]